MYGLPEDLDLSFFVGTTLNYRACGGVLLPLISHDVRCAGRTPAGALRLEWSTGAALEVDDDSDVYES